jgi:Predicted membrane protein (DUF2127)
MRPLGVTLSACFEFLRAALLLLIALGVLFVGGLASRFASLGEEGDTAQRFLSGLGHFLAVAFLLYALIVAILGIGLLVGQNWARILTILFSAFGALTSLPRLLHHHPLSLLSAALNLAVLIYLLMPEAHGYFERKKSSDTSLA